MLNSEIKEKELKNKININGIIIFCSDCNKLHRWEKKEKLHDVKCLSKFLGVMK